MRQEELLAYIDSQEEARLRVSLSLVSSEHHCKLRYVIQISDIYILLLIRRSFAGEFWLLTERDSGRGCFQIMEFLVLTLLMMLNSEY